MNVRNFIFGIAVFLVVGTGCERRAAQAELPNLVIPVGCASEITLLHCDARRSPPKCKSARVTYRGGCEQIAVARK
jgi:hypothetical protein